MKLSSKLMKLIDEAGALQRTASAAKADYDAVRNRLKIALEKEVGEDRWAAGADFKAGLIRDHFNEIDPVRFIKSVESDELRGALLTVSVTKAKTLLAPAVYHDLVKSGLADKPKLYVKELTVIDTKVSAAK